MSCEVCRELKEVSEQLEVDTVRGSKSGYFHLLCDAPIRYCPVCGERLQKMMMRRYRYGKDRIFSMLCGTE